MFIKKIIHATVIAAIISGNLYGKPLSNKHAAIDTSITATVILNNAPMRTHSLQNANTPTIRKKTVHLINRHLTRAQISALSNAIQLQHLSVNENTSSSLPSRVSLGMNKLDVLDQGWYGTCVTFAVTAAMDALLQKGNYVSQLCSLQLTDLLEKQGYVVSEWQGGYADDLLAYLHHFGFVSIAKQKLNTCGGLKEYPLEEIDLGNNTLTLQDYYNMSENFSNNLFWYSLLTANQHETWSKIDSSKAAKKLLEDIKEVLAQPDAKTNYRVVFGVMLPGDFCSAGACGQHNARDDSWVLTSDIRQADNIIFGGHEMVITGYDDNAIAIDNNGVKHKGLLTLRNSWGPEVGDHGDFYMSYEFFKALTDEVFVIGYEPDEE